MPSWVQDPETGKLIPRDEYHKHLAERDRSAFIQGDLQPFVSPITQEVISDRGKLRRHMKHHGVTHASDYSNEYMTNKKNTRDAILSGTHHTCKKERIETLNEAYEKFKGRS